MFIYLSFVGHADRTNLLLNKIVVSNHNVSLGR